MDVLRFQLRVTCFQTPGILVFGEWIQIAGTWAIDAQAVVELDFIELIEFIGDVQGGIQP